MFSRGRGWTVCLSAPSITSIRRGGGDEMSLSTQNEANLVEIESTEDRRQFFYSIRRFEMPSSGWMLRSVDGWRYLLLSNFNGS